MALLVINRFDSKCGECGKGANPASKCHDKVCGYKPAEGCGAEWTQVGSDYWDHDGLYDRIREMRPDLEFVDRWGSV